MRPLITEGYVYAAVPPLYRVIYNKSQSEYLKDDKALQNWKIAHKNITHYDIQRFKGLGEMNADELKETVLNPANRTLRRITVEDVQIAEEALEICMGQDVAPRRKFIEDNAYSITDINI